MLRFRFDLLKPLQQTRLLFRAIVVRFARWIRGQKTFSFLAIELREPGQLGHTSPSPESLMFFLLNLQIAIVILPVLLILVPVKAAPQRELE